MSKVHVHSEFGKLIKQNVIIAQIPYDGPSTLGGSLRCSSQPIYREDA